MVREGGYVKNEGAVEMVLDSQLAERRVQGVSLPRRGKIRRKTACLQSSPLNRILYIQIKAHLIPQ